MAQVDFIDVNGEKLAFMNVTNAVGPTWGMEDDVMLVKALLEIVLTNMRWVSPDKLSSSKSGTFDTKTKNNIMVFQKNFNKMSKQANHPERLSEDSRVSRARGAASWDRNRPWTIAKLNETASFCVRNHGYKSAADVIKMAYPHVAQILKLDQYG